MGGTLGYDHTVDLWSLGVVLFVMLMGAYPFDGVSAPIERQIQNPRLDFRSPITGRVPSDPAQNLISSLIKVRGKDRLPLGDCLKHHWFTTANSTTAAKGTDVGDCPSEY